METVSSTEQALLSIWSTLLGGALISPDDSFFDLGGTSLAGSLVCAQILIEMGVTVDPVELYTCSNIRDLAVVVEARRRTRNP